MHLDSRNANAFGELGYLSQRLDEQRLADAPAPIRFVHSQPTEKHDRNGDLGKPPPQTIGHLAEIHAARGDRVVTDHPLVRQRHHVRLAEILLAILAGEFVKEVVDFMKRYSYTVTPKSKMEHDVDQVISKQIMFHLEDFFKQGTKKKAQTLKKKSSRKRRTLKKRS